MSNSAFAANLSSQLQSFFPITDGEELANLIDFNVRFIEKHKDDFASLLFLEFGTCSTKPISSQIAKTLVSRVAKRIYRSMRKVTLPIAMDVEAKNDLPLSEVERAIEEFSNTLSISDAILFNMICSDDVPIRVLCQKLDMKKSAVYKRVAELRARFERFVL